MAQALAWMGVDARGTGDANALFQEF